MKPLNDEQKECLHVIKTMADWFTRMERKAGRYGDLCPWHEYDWIKNCDECPFFFLFLDGCFCLLLKAARKAGKFLSHERLSAEDSEIPEGRRILDL